MALNNGKAKKPGPKHFSSNPANWCNLIKPSDGLPCEAPRKAGTERCAKHQTYTANPENVQGMLPGIVYVPPSARDVKTLQDVADYIETMMNEVRTGILPPLLSNAVANLIREYVKVKIAQERLDPKKIAGRLVSREAAIRVAAELTDAQVDEILASKEALLMTPAIDPDTNLTKFIHNMPATSEPEENDPDL